MKTPETSLLAALNDNESVKIMLLNMQKFNDAICEQLMNGTDFTIKLEVRGDKGRLGHCKTETLVFDRPRK